MTSRSLPAAAGVRAPWTTVPEHLRARVLDIVGGGELVEAVSQTGGFSPGPAVRLRTSTGRRAFVKAVSAQVNPDSPLMHRREAEYSAQMPPDAPVPKLLGALDEDDWVILVFEEIDGRNPGPDWDPAELRRVVRALGEMAELLTPAPIDVPPVAERLVGFTGWGSLAEARAAGEDDLAWLDPWALDRLDRLAAIEAELIPLCAGDTLANLDVRADNILVAADRVYFVDWPWAARGAAWLDMALFVPNVWMYAGPDLARIVIEHPLLAAAPKESVHAFALGIAGMVMHASRQPAPPGLPTLRPFQKAFSAAGLEWVRSFGLL
ncbi:phosphotransferase family protein [Catenulispora pinisilvae]|uniref:phosphotransferase family protein n=1 Tax=Catenulispora pinisilvae TaxID=2705253 RepID=UPI0018918958|nr:phosphotransferase [Catenulispora pinisilvae]